jgi:hypothetical protein
LVGKRNFLTDFQMKQQKEKERKAFWRNFWAVCVAFLAVVLLSGAGGGGGETPIPNLRMEGTARVVGDSYLQAEPTALLKGIARAPRYAVFQFPLGLDDNMWTDFEIKGSVNNFDGSADNALVYFYASAGSAGGTITHGAIGQTHAVYYTDDLGGKNHGAARKWRRFDGNGGIFNSMDSESSTIGGIVVVVPVDDEVINPHNGDLIFVYQRVSPTSMEEIWVPIIPQWTVVAPLGESAAPFKKY